MLRILVIAAAVALAPVPALAHKVIFGVFPSGDKIEGELGFSNGDAAVGETIEAFDAQGNKLGEALTDEDGFFVFTPTVPVLHRFRADLGAGHTADAEMSAQDVAKILGVAAEVAEAAAESVVATPASGTITVASLTTEERLAIAEAVRDEMRPLRQEIAAYKEHNDLQTILGGIGYIMGLFGIAFYVAARRKLAADP